jgi:DNA-binding response OmpR family regulator
VTAFDRVDDAREQLTTQRQAPKAVVLELLPSPEDAWRLVEDLRTNHSGVAVVVLTSYVRPDRAHRQRAKAAGVAAFIGKPCALRQLLSVAKRVLSGERGIEIVHYTESK